MFSGVSGERRVGNVMVGGEPIDPEATYTVAGSRYVLQMHGDGQTAFDGAKEIKNGITDMEVIIRYLESTDGEVSSEYADPYGQGRIKVIQ